LAFITEFPVWFIIFCFILGAVYAFLLYFRDVKTAEFSSLVKKILFSLRFITVTFLSFLLLGPLLKSNSRKIEKPLIIFAIDNSQSLIIGKDSSYYRNDFPNQIKDVADAIAEKYEVKTYSFGTAVSEDLPFSFADKQTDVSELLNEIFNRYSHRNVGALILASDGIYNKGINPFYYPKKFTFPFFTVGLGDTTVKKDLILAQVNHNRIAYLGNTFPLEIIVDAYELKGLEPTLIISKAGKQLFTQKIAVNTERFNITIPVMLEAKEPGIQRYKISLTQLNGEISYINNEKDIFIDVLDGRQKVLIVANSPHPDIAGLKAGIEANDNYEVTVTMADNVKEPIKKFNLVILHQLPTAAQPSVKLLEEIYKNKIPRLFILGNQSSIQAFNANQTGLHIAAIPNRFNETLPHPDKNFTLFNLSDYTIKSLKKFPPIISPFGTYKLSNSAYTFLKQRVGIVDTEDPLIVFNAADDIKTGVIAGEGIWRWRISDYALNKSHIAFNEICSKIIQYLAVKEDKNQFRVITRNEYNEDQQIEFEAELYNDIYELINEPEVAIVISNSENNKFPYTFTRTTRAYKLIAGTFPVGEYRYEAKVKSGDKVYVQKGEFTVSPLQIEALNTVADHRLLYQLAQKQDGEFLYPADLSKLPEMLAAREDIKPVIFNQQQLDEIINLKWVFFLLLVLISLEWFMRKRSGSY
jgi:hypothetical protein